MNNNQLMYLGGYVAGMWPEDRLERVKWKD